jgi:hypothetical protein
MVTGGSEAAVTIAGEEFNAMHALSTEMMIQLLLLDQWTRTETASF